MKKDITMYTDRELSLQFLNDEGLYNAMRRAVYKESFSEVREVAEENFIYTDEQLDDLAETFKHESTE